MITEQLIRRESGEYDCEVITRLKLENFGIQNIRNLNYCISLVELSLARNELQNTAGLETVTTLKRLDLSFNRIDNITSLENLIQLEWIDLRQNLVSKMDYLNVFSQMPALTVLFLKNSDGSESNPVCNHPAYQNVILRSITKLETLDGECISLLNCGGEIDKALQALQPSEESLRTPPVEPWFSPSDLTVTDVEDGDATTTGTGTVFEPVNELLDKSKELLTEDCAHLLRLAQSAISKAGRDSKS